MQGSSGLIQQLLANDLIDEFRLLIYPLVLGRGKRLLRRRHDSRGLQLHEVDRRRRAGCIIANYERAGEIKTGSFAMETPTPAEIERRKNLA